jgi:hypothetical protein
VKQEAIEKEELKKNKQIFYYLRMWSESIIGRINFQVEVFWKGVGQI